MPSNYSKIEISFLNYSNNNRFQRFSVLFICVTATSDLICYLFIPIRMLIFLATTYVWISLYYHTQGGFLRSLATVYGGFLTKILEYQWNLELIKFS